MQKTKKITKVQVLLPKPHPAQRVVLRSTARWRVLRAGRRFGKSLVAKDVGINKMLASEKVAYLTPTFSLAKKFYRSFIKTIPLPLIRRTNSTDLEIDLITGGSIKFFSGEAIDSFRGSKFHFVIVDEAAFIKNFENSWNEVVRPTLADYKGGALFISTPRGMNFFYSLCTKGENGEKDYEAFHFSSYDNPFIAASEIDAARDEMPEEIFKQEFLALASENAANAFGTKHIDKNVSDILSTKPPVVFGIDVAKTGDWTVITGLDEDGRCCYFDRFRGMWAVTKAAIMALPAGVLKVMDATGAGDVILEDLILMGACNVEGVVYTNAEKAKLMYELILDVQKGGVTYNTVTGKEMHVFEYTYSSTGVLKFNAQAGYHDDCVNSLALANRARKRFQLVKGWKLHAA